VPIAVFEDIWRSRNEWSAGEARSVILTVPVERRVATIALARSDLVANSVCKRYFNLPRRDELDFNHHCFKRTSRWYETDVDSLTVVSIPYHLLHILIFQDSNTSKSCGRRLSPEDNQTLRGVGWDDVRIVVFPIFINVDQWLIEGISELVKLIRQLQLVKLSN